MLIEMTHTLIPHGEPPIMLHIYKRNAKEVYSLC